MVTRLYLPSTGSYSGTPPGIHGGWDSSASIFAVRQTDTIKQDTALASFNSSAGIRTTHQTIWQQWISHTISADTVISGGADIVVRGSEGATNHNMFLGFAVRVLQGDTSTARGVLCFRQANSSGTEWGTTLRTRIWNDELLTTVNASAGDRISVEVGMIINTAGANPSGSMYFGDTIATADFALTSNLTTNLVPWIELSTTIPFGNIGTTDSGGAFFNFFM